MKILSITAQKPGSTGSGVYMAELVRAFHKMGLGQAVVAGVYEEDQVTFPDGVLFYPVCFHSGELPFAIAGMSDEMPYESTVYSRMDGSMVSAMKLAFFRRISQAVEEFRPDLILCHHLYLVTALVRERFPGRKVAAVCHGTGIRQMKKTDLERDYIRRNICNLDRIFALHEIQRQEIIKVYGADPQRITVLGSGYNEGIFYPEVLGKTGGKRFIYAGKLSEKKGVFSLVRAYSKLPPEMGRETRLCLAGGNGSAGEMRQLKDLIAQCPYPVCLLGRLDQKELAREFNKSQVFVLPSFYEGLPLVLIEALACGLLPLSTDLPGVREWMEVHIPGNPIRYVELPALLSADEPVADQLPEFEQRLAGEMAESLRETGRQKGPAPELRGLSWEGLCGRLLSEIEGK